MRASLLVELLTEELPPKALPALQAHFAAAVLEGLQHHALAAASAQALPYATPRRLAVLIPQVLDAAPQRAQEITGPPVNAPAAAVAGFARKHGLAPEALEQRVTPKGAVLLARVTLAGATLDGVLAAVVQAAVKRLPVPRLMRWGSGEAQFVRPVHGLVMLHGTRTVPGSVLGLSASSTTRGHRFVGAGAIALRHADEYEARLRDDGGVEASFETRRAEIDAQLRAAATSLDATLGAEADTAPLLAEVTAMVEQPAVYVGAFDAAFLSVPQECLILTMRQNQRYFPLFDAAGRLLPKFLIVANLRIDDPSHIVRGNQRVVRPRLEDARFFYDQDRKTPLEARLPGLAGVVYHHRLGSLLERVGRLEKLAAWIARELGADVTLAERAARLAKADLLTGMVGEFPELQGVMGRYYALHDGEPAVLADALEAHYWPRYSGDRLPEGPIACAVALADKLDALVGIFGCGQLPSGDKDPFALRRQALGVLRILAERQLPLDLERLLAAAQAGFPQGRLVEHHERDGARVANAAEVASFLRERARGYLRELGYTALEVDAVLDFVARPDQLAARLAAVRSFAALPQAAALAECDKRIRNILAKSEATPASARTDEALQQLDAERQLLSSARRLGSEVQALADAGRFSDALLRSAQIHAPVSRFFDEVMVNVEDARLRLNRLALLREVWGITNRVANLSKLAP